MPVAGIYSVWRGDKMYPLKSSLFVKPLKISDLICCRSLIRRNSKYKQNKNLPDLNK
jgi:hypothetical protein